MKEKKAGKNVEDIGKKNKQKNNIQKDVFKFINKKLSNKPKKGNIRRKNSRFILKFCYENDLLFIWFCR